MLRGASHVRPRQSGVSAYPTYSIRSITDHSGAVMSSDLSLGRSGGFRHFIRTAGGRPISGPVGDRLWPLLRCDEGIPFHSGAVRSCGISLGRSEGFRHFAPTHRGASNFHPRRRGAETFHSDAMRSTPFHPDAVRSSGISLGRCEGLLQLTPTPGAHLISSRAGRGRALPPMR
jgi:hypothetical protein